MSTISDISLFVAELKALSAPERVAELKDYFGKFSKQILALGNELSKVLSNLDPVAHCPSYLAILLAQFVVYQLNEEEDKFEGLFKHISEFVAGSDKTQLNTSPTDEFFCELIHNVTEAVVKKQIPMRGIPVVEMAVKKLRLTEQHLTPIHADFCQLCLVASHPSAALRLINIDIVEYQPAEKCIGVHAHGYQVRKACDLDIDE
ncbi:hypothetical protein QYM36_009133 [Artemia franciscana]|uniref:COP9 signalosome complex subunit 3 N-terminal helical repeats domain-containing protein n=1 Tax=Artemia franciscana TaxID=6661 RepID=A0AA88LB33_ARTSF|nr:hypothetical protein QYM36_009133 [Artemia franciscana]